MGDFSSITRSATLRIEQAGSERAGNERGGSERRAGEQQSKSSRKRGKSFLPAFLRSFLPSIRPVILPSRPTSPPPPPLSSPPPPPPSTSDRLASFTDWPTTDRPNDQRPIGRRGSHSPSFPYPRQGPRDVLCPYPLQHDGACTIPLLLFRIVPTLGVQTT